MDTCSEFQELRAFELKASEIYQITISFFMKVSQCVLNNDDIADNDVHEIMLFDDDVVVKEETDYQLCFLNGDAASCKETC